MNVCDIETFILDNSNNPNISRGCVGHLTLELLEEYKTYFDKTYFKTHSIRSCVWCVRKNYKSNVCKCGKIIEWNGSKYSNTCSKSCASTRKNKRGKYSKLNNILRVFLCPNCNEFKSKCKNRRCKSCGIESQKRKMSVMYRNPEYIKMLSVRNRKTDEQKLRQSEYMKNLILEGKFTPKSNNRRTNKRLYYDNKSFRSSWELKFYKSMQSKGISLEYETLRIKYKHEDKIRVYIVDFVDPINKIAYEVKPKSMIDDLTISKENALIDWCNKHDYRYEMITEDVICAI